MCCNLNFKQCRNSFKKLHLLNSICKSCRMNLHGVGFSFPLIIYWSFSMILCCWVAGLLSWQVCLDGYPRSRLLTHWIGISARSHAGILLLNTGRLVLFILDGLEPWASFMVFGATCLFPSSVAVSQVAESPWEDGDGEGKDRGADEELGESCSAPAIQRVAQGG